MCRPEMATLQIWQLIVGVSRPLRASARSKSRAGVGPLSPAYLPFPVKSLALA